MIKLGHNFGVTGTGLATISIVSDKEPTYILLCPEKLSGHKFKGNGLICLGEKNPRLSSFLLWHGLLLTFLNQVYIERDQNVN